MCGPDKRCVADGRCRATTTVVIFAEKKAGGAKDGELEDAVERILEDAKYLVDNVDAAGLATNDTCENWVWLAAV